MKARIPKQYRELSDRDRSLLDSAMAELCTEKVNERLDREIEYSQQLFIKLSCILLHEVYGFGEDRLSLYIASFKRKYNMIGNMKSNDEVRRYLDTEIDKVFRKSPYPDEWINKL